MDDSRSCHDKAAYQSPDAAKAAALQADYQYERGEKLVPYLCSKCNLYHLKTDYSEDD